MQNTQITPFMFGETLVRTLTDSNGSFWFIAKDVCKVLGLDNVGQAISMLDEDEKSSIAPNIIRADVGMGASFKAGRLSTRTAIPEAGRGGEAISPHHRIRRLRFHLPQPQTTSQGVLQMGALGGLARTPQDWPIRDARHEEVASYCAF